MNNNSAEINNNAEIAAMTKTFKMEIADATGHSSVFANDLDSAVDTIVKHAEEAARWVYINGAKFEFAGTNLRTEGNIARLKTSLQAVEDPLIVLTGKLVGGQI